MPAFIRWFFAIPLGALITAFLFLLIYSHIAPRPLLYRSAEEPNKVYLELFDQFEPVAICFCDWFFAPEPVDSSNAWTNSEKASPEPPQLADEKPNLSTETEALPCTDRNEDQTQDNDDC